MQDEDCVAGFLAASALCLQLGEDIPHAWTERGFGVTHDQFIHAYERLAVTIGGTYGLAGALLYVAAGGSAAVAAAGGVGLYAFGALTLAAVIAVPPIVTPYLMFQIEARRPAINMLIVLIAGLFIGTAVFANPLGLLLVGLLRYYAGQTQAGRFYRA